MTAPAVKKVAARIAFLGPKGTFSQAAVQQHFGGDAQLLECASIDDVFAAVAAGSAEYGVVPVENSTEGAINNTQDCLIESRLFIVGEEIVQIEHNLMVQPGGSRQQIHTIASHKQSLAQCRRWLQVNFPSISQRECASNAEAAKLALADPSVAAIAGAIAADTYGLEILERAIQDQHHNSTRFLVLANARTESTGRDKTSILVYTENKPGALFRVLEPFESMQISLTKIETRPSKKEAWEYVFFIDFEGHRNDPVVQRLFEKLATCTAEVKLLGSYPMARR